MHQRQQKQNSYIDRDPFRTLQTEWIPTQSWNNEGWWMQILFFTKTKLFFWVSYISKPFKKYPDVSIELAIAQ